MKHVESNTTGGGGGGGEREGERERGRGGERWRQGGRERETVHVV